MNINPSIFKSYDIRGLYPQDINKETIITIIKAIYTFFVKDLKKKKATVILSRDMRISSPILFEMAKMTLVDLGASVIDIGLSSTPTFYFTVRNLKADCGIQISASHNPKDYNGLKFVEFRNGKIVKISKITGMDQVKELAIKGNFIQSYQKGTVSSVKDCLQKELEELIASLNFGKIKKFKIVADCANAMGALYLDELAKKVPIELVRINFKLDGTFPVHQPDPLQFKLLKPLQEKVLSEKADLGIAPDGDGDRVFFINEIGQIIPATHISSLIAQELLTDHKGERIIVDIRYTRNVANVCKKYGGRLSISKVGHALITEQLNREDAIFAGESSGHFYFKQTGGAESSLLVILMLLKIMNREQKPISKILSSYVVSIESGESNFILPKEISSEFLLNYLANEYSDGNQSELDGLAVDYKDWRFSVRTSNTEPLLRLNIEGDSKEIVNNKVNEIKNKLIAMGAQVKE